MCTIFQKESYNDFEIIKFQKKNLLDNNTAVIIFQNVFQTRFPLSQVWIL